MLKGLFDRKIVHATKEIHKLKNECRLHQKIGHDWEIPIKIFINESGKLVDIKDIVFSLEANCYIICIEK